MRQTYNIDDLLGSLKDFGVRLTVVGIEANLWDASEFRGRSISPPVRLSLDSDEAVDEYVKKFDKTSLSSGEPLELAMMNCLEVIETVDLEGASAFAAFVLRKQKGSTVDEVWQRRAVSEVKSVDASNHLSWSRDRGQD